MSDPSRYPVPAATHRVEQEISRSRFITTIARASTVDEATALVRQVSAEFDDATHNCWAFVIGPPGDTARIGMSDAGEPHGTAGRPMLNALLHGGVGDIVAVVTRYYGGTKLGTGGLVRAYGGGVQRALETLPRAERIEYVRATVSVDYAAVEVLERTLEEHGARIDGRRFDTEAHFDVRVPDTDVDRVQRAVRDVTRGQGRWS